MKNFVLIISVFLVSCGDGPSTGNSPEQMFEALIESPIPKSVRKLQGTGDTWQGYSLYIRFNASNEDIDKIINSSYKKADWSDVSYRFRIPSSYDIFSPKWQPNLVKTKECYRASVSNAWTQNGSHYLLVDRSQNLVYIYAVGS